jgi:hypothetical protein
MYQMKKGGSSKPKMKSGGSAKFPDLTGDNKVTQADILKGRGVIKKNGGSTKMKMGGAVKSKKK